MNIDFEAKIKNIYGGEILGEDEKPIRLGSLCVNALMGVFKDEENLKGEEKIRRTLLAEKLVKKSKGTTITFNKTSIDVEDIVLLKELSNKMFPSPTLYTSIVRLLEGKTERKLNINGTVADDAVVDEKE